MSNYDPSNYLFDDLFDNEKTPTLLPVDTRKCTSCYIELLMDVDKYWGVEPYADKLCYPCRKRLGIRG